MASSISTTAARSRSKSIGPLVTAPVLLNSSEGMG